MQVKLVNSDDDDNGGPIETDRESATFNMIITCVNCLQLNLTGCSNWSFSFFHVHRMISSFQLK